MPVSAFPSRGGAGRRRHGDWDEEYGNEEPADDAADDSSGESISVDSDTSEDEDVHDMASREDLHRPREWMHGRSRSGFSGGLRHDMSSSSVLTYSCQQSPIGDASSPAARIRDHSLHPSASGGKGELPPDRAPSADWSYYSRSRHRSRCYNRGSSGVAGGQGSELSFEHLSGSPVPTHGGTSSPGYNADGQEVARLHPERRESRSVQFRNSALRTRAASGRSNSQHSLGPSMRYALRSAQWSSLRDFHSDSYVVRHVSEELCCDNYPEDTSKRIKCCGCLPLIFTRKGWKLIFSVFAEENNFDRFLRNYQPKRGFGDRHNSSRSSSNVAPSVDDAGPPSNTMYSAGMALSRGPKFAGVGAMAALYAGRVEQFSKEPSIATKHKQAMYRLMKGYPFMKFRYEPLNDAYDYLLEQVIPLKLIWISFLALVAQTGMTACQLHAATHNSGVLVDAILRAAVFFPYLFFLMFISLFECFRKYTEKVVAAVSACVFVFCCVFESWQVIAVRSGSTGPRIEGRDGSLQYTTFDVLQQGDSYVELLLIVLLTASSIRTSLLFYVHLAALANVLFKIGVQCTTVGGGLLIGTHVSEGYTTLVCLLAIMYLGYYKETCHRMAFYSWYCAKYKACPAGITKKLMSMTTFSRW
ncbi:transmembrane protein [Cystoisospora suis]|uniref:Transmembrane protein n=1 Tax=Cystoisospora suis TaxID=483139 RepID=A0A2C6L8Z7_9APIC|nr:transmembrane protein [Cystoisospora suis]